MRWIDEFEGSQLFARLSGARNTARVLAFPIEYKMNKKKRSGYAYHYGSVAGIAPSIPEAKKTVEFIAANRC
jgi:hypothetical protein